MRLPHENCNVLFTVNSATQQMVSGTHGGRGAAARNHATAAGSGGCECARVWLSQGNSVRAMARRFANAASSVAQVTLWLMEPHESIMWEWAKTRLNESLV